MKYPENPCKHCIDDRHPGCHDNCKKHHEWKVEMKVYNEVIDKARKIDRDMRNTDVQRAIKIRNSRRRK